MTQQEIQQRNQQIALMLGWERHNHGSYFTWTKQNSKDHFYESILQFHSDWNWLMEAVEFICNTLGHRKYSYSHEDHSRCVFTDMAILHQTHDFGGGNIVIDSGTQNTEKEAVFIAVSDFAKLYNDKKL
jgi:hypothetical protein